MAKIQLAAQVRQGTGKGPARQTRFAGRVPANIYGAGEGNLNLTINSRELEKSLSHRGGNVLVSLNIEGANPADRVSLVREIQRDPVSGRITHVDFQQVSLTQQVILRVPVVVHGIPEGVKTGGGILEHMVREVEVRCLAGDIPNRIDVDVTGLGIMDSVHVRDLSVDKVEILSEPDMVLASVVPPTVEKGTTVTATEAAPVDGAKEPELVGKKPGSEGAGDPKGK